MFHRIVPLAVLLLAGGCASLPSRLTPKSESDRRFETALSALDQSDFAAARTDLEWLVSRCEAGAKGRSALLLLASAELDPLNPRGSPAEAARLAGAYLNLPRTAPSEVPLARTLYLLAVDREPPSERRGGMGDLHAESAGVDSAAAEGPLPLAKRFEKCDAHGPPQASGIVPEYPGTTTAERLTRLEAELSARSDSLARAHARIADQAKEIADQANSIEELQAEIARIRKLLKGGGGAAPWLR